jgi:hypothetical protein
MVVATILSHSATLVGFMAGAIAVGGFIAHAGPALSGQRDEGVRSATVLGGLAGLAVSLFVAVISGLVE